MNHGILWALLANGSLAKLVKNPDSGTAQDVSLISTENLKSREMLSDRPGRSFASEGNRRSAMAWHSDPVRQQERLFADRLSSHLLRSVDNGEFDSLVVAAAPRTLGDLRQAFPDRLHDRVVCEVAKDLTGIPEQEIGSAIKNLLETVDNQ